MHSVLHWSKSCYPTHVYTEQYSLHRQLNNKAASAGHHQATTFFKLQFLCFMADDPFYHNFYPMSVIYRTGAPVEEDFWFSGCQRAMPIPDKYLRAAAFVITWTGVLGWGVTGLGSGSAARTRGQSSLVFISYSSISGVTKQKKQTDWASLFL